MGIASALNFALTNRLPRRSVTRFAAWFTRVQHPLVRDASLFIWQLFAGGLNLHEAKKRQFTSVHDVFVRELKEGSRPLDKSPDAIVSPCDGIVGAFGAIQGGQLIQAKGMDYTLGELLIDPALASRFEDGIYATLRLTSTMYHRFHAPYNVHIDEVIYAPGDVWNVNPPALARVQRVYCRNERAIIPASLDGQGASIAIVAVAAILVDGIRLEFANTAFRLGSSGPRRITCKASVRKGHELGHFQHGSTIIVLGTRGLALDANISSGQVIKVGQRLFRLAARSQPSQF